MGGKAQIVVGAQHDPAFAFHDYFRILLGFQRMEIGIDAGRSYLIRLIKTVKLFENIHQILQLLTKNKNY